MHDKKTGIANDFNTTLTQSRNCMQFIVSSTQLININSNIRRTIVCFLLGNSPASEFLYADVSEHCLFYLHTRIGAHLSAYEDGTDSVPKRLHIKFRRRGELPRRKHKTFRTRWKFEIKNQKN